MNVRRLTGRGGLIASAVLALILAGLIGLLTYSHQTSLAQSRAWVYHTHTVIEQNLQLLSQVQDAETGMRGFLLTHDVGYLEPYISASRDIPVSSARLTALVRDNPHQVEQVRRLNDAVTKRLGLIDRAIAQGRQGDFDGALKLVRLGEGRSQMIRIRELTASISESERGLLQTRTERAERADRFQLLIGLAVGALSLIGIFASAFAQASANRRLTRSQAARAATDALQQAIFQNSPDYLFVLEVEGQDRFVIGDINPSFEKALHVDAAMIRGRSLSELLPERAAEIMIAHYRRVMAADSPVLTRDIVPGLPDGPRTWESILAPLRNASGVTDRIIGTVRDITDRVRADERLNSAMRMESVGQLTGGVAHDFNNLLQVIRGNLELLAPAVEDHATAKRRLDNALHGVERAGQLTRQLLAFARRQPLEPQVINLSRMVSDMAELLRRTLGETVEVETVFAGGLWNTLADPAQIESAILNLALNARDAMPEGGRLTIELTNAVLDEAYARQHEDLAPGQYVLLAVSDTGKGMDAAVKARVFEPFFTTKPEGKGTGLGLAMVYGFVKQSSGHVQIYSEPGQGTTLKIYLPRSNAAEAAPAVVATRIRPGRGRTILVVEDEPTVRAAAVATLQELGHSCLEAGSAHDALALLNDGAKVDLVFSDVVMPGPLKTRDFVRAVAELSPELPILFTSGYTENAIVHHGRLDEGVSLISKPYARDELARRIAVMLDRAAAGR